MDYGYSPHREAGGTLHLPSPTHAHSYKDAFPSIKQIRKSLSRSPSKSPRFHLHDARSPSQSPRSPISPLAFMQASSTTPAGNPPMPSPSYDATHPVQATPVGKKGKLTLRRVAPFRSSPRTRTTSKSPVRRPLSEATNRGNSTPAFNYFRSSNSSDDSEGDNTTENAAPSQVAPSLPFDMNDGLTKFDFLKPRDAYTAGLRCQMPAKSSPLKRSDGIMNLDQATLGSPSAKRRSLHGASFGADFNIFDQAQAMGNGEQTNTDFDSDFSFATPPPRESPIRKSLSLRKSTLVQRYGASAAKTRPAPDAVSPFALPNQAASRSKLRMSLDGSITATDNDTSSMFRQSLHQARPHSLYQQDGAWPEKTNALHASRHPLATALTPSSSSSSMADDSPTHNPAHVLTAINPYSRATRLQEAPLRKSLPIGATRPSAHPSANTSESSAYATPEAYKLAKPDPAAFMSTGLISKRNRNIEEPPLDESPNRVMPDTPSKRTSYPPMSTTPFAGAAFGKSTHTRPEFGTPSTPFSSHANKVSLESFGQGVSVFGARLGNAGLNRRGSFVSIDGDDASQSPTGRMESQSSADELPPTPTKPATASGRNSKENSLRSSLFGRRTSLGADTFIAPGTENAPPKTTRKSKLAHFFTGQESDETKETASRRSPPSVSMSPDSSGLNPSPSEFGRAQCCEADGQSTPRPTKSLQVLVSPCDGKNVTKTSLPPIARPTSTAEASEQTSPHTPQEHYNPPDPSTLSISARDRPLSASFNSSFSGRASFPPATPTAPRNENFYFAASHTGVPLFSGRVSVRNEIDTALSTRFKTVTLHGSGEFSQVYRVENPTTPVGAQPGSSSVGQVWAVKKTKKPFIGVKDRERRRREVQILRALRGNDHVIRFDDSWEANGHLYIQTEYCENGNLKDFLRVTGDKARLDDFRVWKILLELSMVCPHFFAPRSKLLTIGRASSLSISPDTFIST